jgi:hypothetical protein
MHIQHDSVALAATEQRHHHHHHQQQQPQQPQQPGSLQLLLLLLLVVEGGARGQLRLTAMRAGRHATVTRLDDAHHPIHGSDHQRRGVAVEQQREHDEQEDHRHCLAQPQCRLRAHAGVRVDVRVDVALSC